VAADGQVTVAGIDPARRGTTSRSSPATIGSWSRERRVTLAGAVNLPRSRRLREPPRAATQRWGARVSAPDELNRLNDDGPHRALPNLGLKLLCDFRSPDEYGRAPGSPPDQRALPQVAHLPVYDPTTTSRR
jgi:hypothetical protein